MAGRRLSFSRVLDFFREADTDEVRAIMPLVLEAVQRRKIGTTLAPVQRRRRRLNGTDVISTTDSQTAAATA